MVGRILLTAAVVACATAQKSYFAGCGCGDAIATSLLTTTTYCPSSGFVRGCNVSLLVENACTITCDEKRSKLAYKNGTSALAFSQTSSISCKNGQFVSAEGKTIVNPRWPTCGVKAVCDQCSLATSPTCPTGFTCKSENFAAYIGADGCAHGSCNEGTIKLYDGSNEVMPYSGAELFCTINGSWANYSLDGGISGGSSVPLPFTVNCVLPKGCENCVAPKMAASLADLPVPFRTNYTFGTPSFIKKVESCSIITCNAPFQLYGFSANVTGVTGFEYTSKGYLLCDGNSFWRNGGQTQVPNNFTTVCLAPLVPTTTGAPTTTTKATTTAPTTTIKATTTAPPTTTLWPCGAYDAVTLAEGLFACTDGQTRIKCPAGKKIEVLTNELSTKFETMTFIAGKGWLAFDCDGTAQLYKTGANEIVGVDCQFSI